MNSFIMNFETVQYCTFSFLRREKSDKTKILQFLIFILFLVLLWKSPQRRGVKDEDYISDPPNPICGRLIQTSLNRRFCTAVAWVGMDLSLLATNCQFSYRIGCLRTHSKTSGQEEFSHDLHRLAPKSQAVHCIVSQRKKPGWGCQLLGETGQSWKRSGWTSNTVKYQYRLQQ